MNSLTLTINVKTFGDFDEQIVPKHQIALRWLILNADSLPAKGEQKIDYDEIHLSWEVKRGEPDAAEKPKPK